MSINPTSGHDGWFDGLHPRQRAMASMPEREVCFLVPGPVRMGNNVLSAMSAPVMTARGPEYCEIMAELNSLLRMTFNLSPSSSGRGQQSWTGDDGYRVIMVSGSGTAALEMAIANRLSENEKVLVPSNGKFGERLAQIASVFADCTHLKHEWGKAFDLMEIESRLASGQYEAFVFCHNETSSGITQDAATLSELCRKYAVAFIIDGITSVGGIPVHPQDWTAEAVVIGAQKCTAGPSGVAALAVSQNWVEAAQRRKAEGVNNPGFYLDVHAALKKGGDDQTPWTPAINLTLGWREALRNLAAEGLDSRWQRCRLMAGGVRSLFTSLGFELLADDGQRSDTVTAIIYPEGIDDGWRNRLQSEYKTFVIGGQDHLKGRIFRIGSMGETPVEEMIEGCTRMIRCFRDCDLAIPEDIDVASHFRR